MKTRKRIVKEPLLNSVARELGHTAGTITHVAKGLMQSLSARPVKISRKKSSDEAPAKAHRRVKTNGRGVPRTGTPKVTAKKGVASPKGNRGNRKPPARKTK